MEPSHERSRQGSFDRCSKLIFVTPDQVATSKQAGNRKPKHDGRQCVAHQSLTRSAVIVLFGPTMRLTAWPWSNCEQASFRAASLVGWLRLMWRWLTSQCTTHSDIAFLGRLTKLMLFFMTAPKRSAPQRAIRAPVTEDVLVGGSAAYFNHLTGRTN